MSGPLSSFFSRLQGKRLSNSAMIGNINIGTLLTTLCSETTLQRSFAVLGRATESGNSLFLPQFEHQYEHTANNTARLNDSK